MSWFSSWQSMKRGERATLSPSWQWGRRKENPEHWPRKTKQLGTVAQHTAHRTPWELGENTDAQCEKSPPRAAWAAAHLLSTSSWFSGDLKGGCLRKQGFTQWMLCFWWPELCFYYIYIHISYLGYSLGVFKVTWMRDLEFAKWKLGKKTHT